MTKTENFTLRVTEADKAIFAELARRLNRNQSDAIRVLAREFVHISRHEELMAQSEAKRPQSAIPAN